MRVEFGGRYAKAFEYLKMSDFDAVEDGKITVVGPYFRRRPGRQGDEPGHRGRGGRAQDAGGL